MRSEQEVTRAIEQYSDMVRRLCMIHLKNYADTEDIFQTVFLKYVLSSAAFENEEHEKAWLIRVTINACKDLLRNFFHSHVTSLDEIWEHSTEMQEDHREVLEAVLSLPQKYIYITMRAALLRKSVRFWGKGKYDLYAPDPFQANASRKVGR